MEISPLVSVVVPVYNVENYIGACVESILRQTYTELEVILVEDASSDGSKALAETYLRDARVKIINHTCNKGLSAARNTGADAASGKYILFVDSDDLISEVLIESCVLCAERHAADLVVFGFNVFQDGSNFLPRHHPKVSSPEFNFISDEYYYLEHFAWLKFIKNEVLQFGGIRFPVGYFYEDWSFHWELGLHANKIVKLDADLYYYRQREGSITSSSSNMLLDVLRAQQLLLDYIKGRSLGFNVSRALYKKIRQGQWGVLVNVDDELLKTAIFEIRRMEPDLKVVRHAEVHDFRGHIVKVLACSPSWVSTLASYAIRRARRRRN